MRAKKSFSLKTVVLLLAVAAVFGGAVGGTLAWLSDTSDEIVNTFTAGDVSIKLEESDSDNDNNPLKNNYKMVPGAKIAKDPKVTVEEGSEKCWLFVKIEEVNDAADFLTYNLRSEWKPLSGETGVYYHDGIVDATDAAKPFYILEQGEEDYANGFVTVKSTVKKADLKDIKTGEEPQLKITAYAIQSDNLTKSDGTGVTTAADAWALIGS